MQSGVTRRVWRCGWTGPIELHAHLKSVPRPFRKTLPRFLALCRRRCGVCVGTKSQKSTRPFSLQINLPFQKLPRCLLTPRHKVPSSMERCRSVTQFVPNGICIGTFTHLKGVLYPFDMVPFHSPSPVPRTSTRET